MKDTQRSENVCTKPRRIAVNGLGLEWVYTPFPRRKRDWKNRMRVIRSFGSVGEPVGNHRLYPEL